MSSGGPHREAAACVERGIERYAEGAYDAAKRELEAALAIHPGHARALECLAWLREVTGGKRMLVSGMYAALPDAGPVAEPLPPGPAPPVAESPVVPPPAAELPPSVALPSAASAAVLPSPPSRPTTGQLDETPDSVTREWSSMATGAFPQLDVPELSEDQIANLLELDRGRGFTLSKGTPAPAPAAPAQPDDSDDYEELERESTNVRLAARVVEMVAEAEDQTPVPPALSPQGQTGDDPPSMPTNPFVSQRLSELAAPLLASPGEELLPPPSMPAPASSSAAVIEAALRRGATREAFDTAERLADAPGARSAEEQALLARVYGEIVGELGAVPRYGKASPNLDSRSAFMLSRMDGSMSADDLLDVSGMVRSDALRVLARLVVTGVVIMKR